MTTQSAPAAPAPAPAPAADERAGVRGYVFNFVGKDGRRASIAFDRYGRNSEQFMTRSRAQLTSNALGSIMADPNYGPDWLESYSTAVVKLTR